MASVFQQQNQIQLYINLEPAVLASTQSSVQLNFETYFDHLLRASEIPMIQFLEQLHSEATVRAEGSSGATPREFQTLLREFVRKRPESRVQLFLEHMRGGKHSFEHLGTMALISVRTLTQSLVAGDHELVNLAQTQSDAARFHIQTGLTFDELFVDAITEAARQLDRNPTYFSRKVRSKQYLENRAAIRQQVASALRASINDAAIKAFSSLRQHIAERTMQLAQSGHAMHDQQQQQQQRQQQTLQTPMALLHPHPVATTNATDYAATDGHNDHENDNGDGGDDDNDRNDNFVDPFGAMPATPPPPTTMTVFQPSGSATSPLSKTHRDENANNAHNIGSFDERASPMSSAEARVAQNDVANSILKLSRRANEMQQKPTTTQESKQKQSHGLPLPTAPTLLPANGPKRVRLEDDNNGARGSLSADSGSAGVARSAQERLKTADMLTSSAAAQFVRTNSDDKLRQTGIHRRQKPTTTTVAKETSRQAQNSKFLLDSSDSGATNNSSSNSSNSSNGAANQQLLKSGDLLH